MGALQEKALLQRADTLQDGCNHSPPSLSNGNNFHESETQNARYYDMWNCQKIVDIKDVIGDDSHQMSYPTTTLTTGRKVGAGQVSCASVTPISNSAHFKSR